MIITNTVSALRKRILIIYIRGKQRFSLDPVEPEWDIIRYMGGLMICMGIVLLLYDYFIIGGCYIYTMGRPSYIFNFMFTSHCSGMGQVWLYLIYLGMGFNIMGEYIGKL